MGLTQSASSVRAGQMRQPLRWPALLPREHGSWALALEPLVLALMVAPTWRGVGVALAAVMLFLARRPFQVANSAMGGAQAPQARGVLAAMIVIALALAGATVGADLGRVVVPLAVACAGGAVFAWFDRKGAGRAALAECAGATAFAAVAVAIVLMVGDPDGLDVALVVGGFAVARAWTSVLSVRAYLRRRKGQATSGRAALAVAAIACLLAIVATERLGTGVLEVWTLVFALRTVWLTGPWAPDWPARRIGWLEAAIGLIASVTTGIALS